MQGITFGDKHTFDDWGLCLVEDPFVDAADPNLNLLEIDGGNGYINLTEVMTGEPTYQSRKKTWKFKTDATTGRTSCETLQKACMGNIFRFGWMNNRAVTMKVFVM